MTMQYTRAFRGNLVRYVGARGAVMRGGGLVLAQAVE
jgi:hypothetical protein